MRNQSSVVSRQLLAGLAALVLAFAAQGAFATKPMPGFGVNSKVGESAYNKQNNTHEKLTAEEAAFWKDKTEYDEIQVKLWPICTAVDSDVAQSCNNLTAEQLKSSYPDETIGGLGARYSVSKEEAEMLKQRKAELEKKWMEK